MLFFVKIFLLSKFIFFLQFSENFQFLCVYLPFYVDQIYMQPKWRYTVIIVKYVVLNNQVDIMILTHCIYDLALLTLIADSTLSQFFKESETLFINGDCFTFVLLLCKLAYQASIKSKNSFQFSTWQWGEFAQGQMNNELSAIYE